MREPFTQLYIHLVWATWDRLPLLTPELRETVYACIQAECRGMKVEVLALGGTADHVHLLVRLPTTITIALLVKQVKGASSHLTTQRLHPTYGFKWQGAYAAFTVSKSEVPLIRAHILRQEEHHREDGLEIERELN